jgi:hypothetical protein
MDPPMCDLGTSSSTQSSTDGELTPEFIAHVSNRPAEAARTHYSRLFAPLNMHGRNLVTLAAAFGLRKGDFALEAGSGLCCPIVVNDARPATKLPFALKPFQVLQQSSFRTEVTRAGPTVLKPACRAAHCHVSRLPKRLPGPKHTSNVRLHASWPQPTHMWAVSKAKA